MKEKAQLHSSAIGKTCMEAFRRRYLEGEIIPPGVAAIVGTGTHKGVEVNLSHKISTGELLPVDAVQDAARDGLIAAWESTAITLTPEESTQDVREVRGQAVDKAVRLARLHHAEKAPEINPVAVERPWSLEIPGYSFELVGTIDVLETVAIRDTKTSGKSPQPDAALRSVQLKAYALAMKVLDGTPPEKVILDYLVDGKAAKAVSLEYEPTDEDFQVVLARIDIIDKMLKSGIFPPAEPGSWACSEKWCGYWRTCRYVAHPKQFSIS